MMMMKIHIRPLCADIYIMDIAAPFFAGYDVAVEMFMLSFNILYGCILYVFIYQVQQNNYIHGHFDRRGFFVRSSIGRDIRTPSAAS